MGPILLLAALPILCPSVQEGEANQALLRENFSRDFKDKNPTKRVQALQMLRALSEEKTMLALAGALKDPDAGVRKAAAEIIASCTDVSGAAIKPLCAVVLNRKKDKGVRSACAKALARARYRGEAIDALVTTISGIGEQEKDLYKFGADCTESLNYLAAQDFGAGKETPAKWKTWWAENKAKVAREDQERLAEFRKTPPPKSK